MHRNCDDVSGQAYTQTLRVSVSVHHTLRCTHTHTHIYIYVYMYAYRHRQTDRQTDRHTHTYKKDIGYDMNTCSQAHGRAEECTKSCTMRPLLMGVAMWE